MKMGERRFVRIVMKAEVSGQRLRVRPRLGWMNNVKKVLRV